MSLKNSKLVAIPFALTFMFMFNSLASAEVQSFHGESVYTMNNGEPIKKAQEKVFNQAIRSISEQAGMYIESRSKLENGNLKKDEMEATTAAVLKVKFKKYGKEYDANGLLKIFVSVDAEMDTDNVEEILKELIEAKKSSKNYEEVLTDYTIRQNQFDTVYGDYINSFQKRVMQKLRDGCKLQNDGKIDEALKFYNEVINETISARAEISRVYIKRGHVYNIQGKNDLASADFEKAITLNNDSVGMHYAKAVLLEKRGNTAEAAVEYREFVKDADIIYYDMEITDALDRIVEIEEVN